jgi:WD40 repeat protein
MPIGSHAEIFKQNPPNVQGPLPSGLLLQSGCAADLSSVTAVSQPLAPNTRGTQCHKKNQFEIEELDWIIRKPIMAGNWSAYLQTLEGHSNWANSVAWSHDASWLASASEDGTVKIWDPATGRCHRCSRAVEARSGRWLGRTTQHS